MKYYRKLNFPNFSHPDFLEFTIAMFSDSISPQAKNVGKVQTSYWHMRMLRLNVVQLLKTMHGSCMAPQQIWASNLSCSARGDKSKQPGVSRTAPDILATDGGEYIRNDSMVIALLFFLHYLPLCN